MRFFGLKQSGAPTTNTDIQLNNILYITLLKLMFSNAWQKRPLLHQELFVSVSCHGPIDCLDKIHKLSQVLRPYHKDESRLLSKSEEKPKWKHVNTPRFFLAIQKQIFTYWRNSCCRGKLLCDWKSVQAQKCDVTSSEATSRCLRLCNKLQAVLMLRNPPWDSCKHDCCCAHLLQPGGLITSVYIVVTRYELGNSGAFKHNQTVDNILQLSSLLVEW